MYEENNAMIKVVTFKEIFSDFLSAFKPHRSLDCCIAFINRYFHILYLQVFHCFKNVQRIIPSVVWRGKSGLKIPEAYEYKYFLKTNFKKLDLLLSKISEVFHMYPKFDFERFLSITNLEIKIFKGL